MTQGIWIPHCPKCGKFVADVTGYSRAERIEKVEGICRKHGFVDLTDQDWSADDFEYEESGLLESPEDTEKATKCFSCGNYFMAKNWYSPASCPICNRSRVD